MHLLVKTDTQSTRSKGCLSVTTFGQLMQELGEQSVVNRGFTVFRRLRNVTLRDRIILQLN